MNKGRKKKVRLIHKMPTITTFSPRGKPGRPEEITLSLDHFEAIKLADYLGYNQTESAVHMKVSRASFGRILREGRKILADGIANGKIIKIRAKNTQVGVTHKKITPKQLSIEIKNDQRVPIEQIESRPKNPIHFELTDTRIRA